MKNHDESLDILAIGLDSFSIEVMKKALKENGLKYHISFLSDLSELEAYKKKTADAIFFFLLKKIFMRKNCARWFVAHVQQK